MLKIEGKTFMNIQEAVQWLLENNALPFQSSANYIANTEIGLGTIVNPSPAKVRIGSLIFFADSKVSTVIGLTENGFIVSEQYNDLIDDVTYVSNVSINASGHLIITLSDGSTIDAGLIKQISNFSISASQHLIANYNDGTSTDLGAIFNGNINIAGNFTANSIIENMTGYSFGKITSDINWEAIYVGCCKNGNKLTFVVFARYTTLAGQTSFLADLGYFGVPTEVGNKLYPFTLGYEQDILSTNVSTIVDTIDNPYNVKGKDLIINFRKRSESTIYVRAYAKDLIAEHTYYFRIEQTFLLGESLAS